MGEEVVTKYKCDKCGVVEEIVLKKGMFGIKKAERPETWGTDKDNKNIFCAKCHKAYEERYEQWYVGFLAGK